MKYRKNFFRTIWVIAIGVIFLISSAFPWGDFSISWAHEFSISLAWVGTVIIIVGIFALAITLLQEYLDRKEENPSKRS
jgi:hypothetical protein